MAVINKYLKEKFNVLSSSVIFAIVIFSLVGSSIAYGESVALPISFQEISGISGGGWSTDITNNVTTIQLTGVTNHNQFDVTNVLAELTMYENGQILCTITDTILSLNQTENGNFLWECSGIADEASGIIQGYGTATPPQEPVSEPISEPAAVPFSGPLTIPISFQEASGITGGAWSTVVNNNVTTIQLTGIKNHNTFDITNIQAQMVFYNNDIPFCTVNDGITSLDSGASGNFVWSCQVSGIPDDAVGEILSFTEVESIEQIEQPTAPQQNQTTQSVSAPISQDHDEVTITPASGSGAPGCEDTANGCFFPSTASVALGGVVIFHNTDTAAHTFTSGSQEEGPSGLFDTGLLMVGNSYEYSADVEGNIPYFCMVHPWKEGLLIVGSSGELLTSQSSVTTQTSNVVTDDTELLQQQIIDLKLENRNLKNQITTLNDEVEELKDLLINGLKEIYNWQSQ